MKAKLTLQEIIQQLKDVNTNVYDLKIFAEKIIHVAESGTIEDVRAVIEELKPLDILKELL